MCLPAQNADMPKGRDGRKGTEVAFHLNHQWQPLIGRQVIIKLKDEEIRRGTVSAVTSDDQVLWLSAEGAEPRRLFERADGFHVWAEYQRESAAESAPGTPTHSGR